MKKSTKRAIIIVFLILELAGFLWPRFYMHGPVLDEPYRNVERKAALYAWVARRTPETKAAYDAEVVLLHRHMLQEALAILIGGLVFDAMGIYLFLKYVPTKSLAQPLNRANADCS